MDCTIHYLFEITATPFQGNGYAPIVHTSTNPRMEKLATTFYCGMLTSQDVEGLARYETVVARINGVRVIPHGTRGWVEA